MMMWQIILAHRDVDAETGKRAQKTIRALTIEEVKQRTDFICQKYPSSYLSCSIPEFIDACKCT
jgi:hypothetical protein